MSFGGHYVRSGGRVLNGVLSLCATCAHASRKRICLLTSKSACVPNVRLLRMWTP